MFCIKPIDLDINSYSFNDTDLIWFGSEFTSQETSGSIVAV